MSGPFFIVLLTNISNLLISQTFASVQWDKPGSQIVQMSTEFSELFTREVTKVSATLPSSTSYAIHMRSG